MYRTLWIALVLTLAGLGQLAAIGLDFSNLVGYYIFSTDKIDGLFDGCSLGKTIEFDSGFSVECIGNVQGLAYDPVATIMIAPLEDEGRMYIYCEMIIGDDIYTVDCDEYVDDHVAFLRSYLEQAEGRQRQIAKRRLILLEAMGF